MTSSLDSAHKEPACLATCLSSVLNKHVVPLGDIHSICGPCPRLNRGNVVFINHTNFIQIFHSLGFSACFRLALQLSTTHVCDIYCMYALISTV